MSTFLDSEVFRWVVLPLLIFLSRIIDVSIGTVRIIFVSKGQRILAPVLGFFEVLIWILAMGQVMQNLTNAVTYIAYAGGFATGNFVGMWIEEKLAMGILVVRVITAKDSKELMGRLGAAGFGATSVEAQGSTGEVTLIYSIVRRKDMSEVLGIIQSFDSRAFYSVEDARTANEGIFPSQKLGTRKNMLSLLKQRRKAK